MDTRPTLIAMDMEGVFTPEIWIAVAEKTGIEKLCLTTRDIPDYDQLMRGRLAILREHGLKLRDLQAVIATLDPLPGAIEFTDWVRERLALVILTDSFYQFVAPLKEKLRHPTIFCNTLVVDEDNNVVDYCLRQRDGKKHATIAFKSLGFRVIGVGDSYNDTNMLLQADHGILFRPSANVAAEFPQFPAIREYTVLQDKISEILQS
jgi:phosphoserine/homoserine phosphotransferase